MNAPMTPEQRKAIAVQIGEAKPATDGLIGSFAEAVANVRNHEHPSWEDLYCMNLTSYMGERMAPVLKRLLDAETEVAALRARGAELESMVAGMHAAAVGEVTAPELGLVEDVRVLRASFLAQKSRADVLDGMARRAQQAAGGLFLAEYDGVPPELHTTVEAARDMCDDIAKVDAHGKYWDWTVQDGVHVQVWTHPDDDRPLSATSGVVTPIEVRPAVVPAAAAQLAGMVDAADALRADRAEGGAS